MNNLTFWKSISNIIHEGFDTEGIQILEQYAEQFITNQLIYQRFTPFEQHGCSKGGALHVIATLLAGAETPADQLTAQEGSFKREQQRAEAQAAVLEQWSKAVGCWIPDVDQTLANTFGQQLAEGGEAHIYDNGTTIIKRIGLDYYILPVLALDRITLHNAFFPETRMKFLGFGRTTQGDFQIVVEQSFIQGTFLTEPEIQLFAESLGFRLINPRNWTYATPSIYLSDLHDENLIKSPQGNIFVIDCDIRINTPELRCGGTRVITTEVTFAPS